VGPRKADGIAPSITARNLKNADSVPVHKKFVASEQGGFIGSRHTGVSKRRRRKVHGGAEAHQPASKKEVCSAKALLMAYRRPACGGNPCTKCLHAAL
jgi:hypothetical protein